VHKEGRDVFPEDGEQLGRAASFVTPLSRLYVLDPLEPRPARAIDGNPATAVTRAS
jgi:iron complex transport system substrate-binding protein